MKDPNDNKTMDWVGFKVGDTIKTCRFDTAEIFEVSPSGMVGLKYKNTVLYYMLEELVNSGVQVIDRGVV